MQNVSKMEELYTHWLFNSNSISNEMEKEYKAIKCQVCKEWTEEHDAQNLNLQVQDNRPPVCPPPRWLQQRGKSGLWCRVKSRNGQGFPAAPSSPQNGQIRAEVPQRFQALRIPQLHQAPPQKSSAVEKCPGASQH